MRTCALASFSSEFFVLEATANEHDHDGGSFSLRENRFTVRCTVSPVGGQEYRRDSRMKGCGRVSHLSPLQPLQHSCGMYDADAVQ